jgi:predicted outer membrane repeat protein
MKNQKSNQLDQKSGALRLCLTVGLAALFLAVLLCGLANVSPAQADPGILYVDGTSGQDIPTCGTTGLPCETISYTLNSRASGGDTIRVAQGVYTENLTVDKQVTLMGRYILSGTLWLSRTGETIIDGSGSVISHSVIIFQAGSSGTLLNGFVLRNGRAESGGGAYIVNATVTISDTTLFSNTAEYGGGLAVDWAAAAIIKSCQFISNTAVNNGGGGGIRSNGEVTIEDSIFQGNSASQHGNGGAIQGRAIVIRRSKILNNHAGNGGGIDVFGSARLEDVEIVGNVATWEGGGFRVGDGDIIVVISNTHILSNTASEGGGVHLYDGSVSIYNTLIKNNKADFRGGGIRASYFDLRIFPDLTLVNTLVVSNTSDEGGGFWLDRWPATVINTTISNNRATNQYGGVWASPLVTQTVAFTNTILWDNGGDDLECTSGCIVAYSDLEEGVWPGTGNISEDPLFVDATNGDYHLRAGSLCIDVGTDADAPLADFEGDSRPLDGDLDGTAGVDIGADEFKPYQIYLPLTLKSVGL